MGPTEVEKRDCGECHKHLWVERTIAHLAEIENEVKINSGRLLWIEKQLETYQDVAKEMLATKRELVLETSAVKLIAEGASRDAATKINPVQGVTILGLIVLIVLAIASGLYSQMNGVNRNLAENEKKMERFSTILEQQSNLNIEQQRLLNDILRGKGK